MHRSPLTWRSHSQPLLVLAVLGFAANAVSFSGFFQANPEIFFIGLQQGLALGWVPGPPGWLDPTVAYITQPFGPLTMSDWLHGGVPWWNPYSGVGMPLAAEMQTSAFFFPFVFLLSLHDGWLLLRAVLMSLCGIFTYALLIELGLKRRAAFLGGALYALSPEFFLDPHAAIAPMPFLPLLLLGVEHAAKAAVEKRWMGWSLVVVGTAYSILGGFPEVTYFGALLALAWTGWRFAGLGPARWRFAGKIMLGGGIGLVLTAPLLVPFLEYVKIAYLGMHQTKLYSYIHLPALLRPLLVFPYLYGIFDQVPPPRFAPLFVNDTSFVRMPGWIGLPVLALIFSGLVRREGWRGLRALLLGWLVLWLARYCGVPPVVWLFDHFPGMATADSTRFSGPMVDFALYLLAAFAFDDYQRLPPLPRRVLYGLLAGLLAVVVSLLLPVAGFLLRWYSLWPHDFVFLLPGLAFAFGATWFVLNELGRPRHARLLLACAAALPLGQFLLPQFADARTGHIDMAPIRYLQAHIGTDRMVSLGAFDLSFPAAYRVASINYISMPAPRLWTSYIAAHLLTDAHLLAGADLNVFRGGTPGLRESVLGHLDEYEALGVRYIVTSAGDGLLAAVPGDAVVVPGVPLQPRRLVPGGPDIAGVAGAALPFQSIAGVSVLAGTYMDTAHGPVLATLCLDHDCVYATADAGSGGDNAPLNFRFDRPLHVPAGQQWLSYRFSHPDGTSLALWFTTSRLGRMEPVLRYIPVAPVMSLVFQDEVAAIYRLDGTLPYFTAGPGCAVTIIDRTHAATQCGAPAVLTRREMYYPGWFAMVNGQTQAVAQAGLFQSVPVPAGGATVSFGYSPTHIRAAWALAVLAALLWAGLGLRARRFVTQ